MTSLYIVRVTEILPLSIISFVSSYKLIEQSKASVIISAGIIIVMELSMYIFPFFNDTSKPSIYILIGLEFMLVAIVEFQAAGAFKTSLFFPIYSVAVTFPYPT